MVGCTETVGSIVGSSVSCGSIIVGEIDGSSVSAGSVIDGENVTIGLELGKIDSIA